MCFLKISIFLSSIWLAFPALTSELSNSILVLDFELKDLTIHNSEQAQLERTAKIRPMLEKELASMLKNPIIKLNLQQQLQADHGKGYLYQHHDVSAQLGREQNAKWVIVGRVHKPSYLFLYLKVNLVDVANDKLVGILAVEVKGLEDKFMPRGVRRLAIQIAEAIENYNQ